MTAFDKVAQTFWQQHQNNLPIGGGMAYESRVRDCQLDESIDSLKRLDALLTVIKNELLAKQMQEELLQQSSFRNFLLFVGFYAGRVLAAQLKQKIIWLDFARLKQDYALTTESHFFVAMAGVPERLDFAPPFFVLNILGAKLFESKTRTFVNPITGDLMPESLYWGVLGYLGDFTNNQKIKTHTQSKTQIPAHHTAFNPNASAVLDKKTSTSQASSAQPIFASIDQAAYQAHFVEIKSDLKNIPAANTTYDEQYQKASLAIDKLYQWTNGNPQKILQLSEQQKNTIHQVVSLLEKLAQKGNTNAMLLFAVCHFEGMGTTQNQQTGAHWVQKAADVGDVRACKLLSRLYYYGLGVAPSTERGKFWLMRAAEGGHAEAKKVQQHFEHITVMQDWVKTEEKDYKRYLMTITMAGVAALLVVELVMSFV